MSGWSTVAGSLALVALVIAATVAYRGFLTAAHQLRDLEPV
jgi:hypothetical protein